jgi:hypothetical protein
VGLVSTKLLARGRALYVICDMPDYLGRLLFPNDRGAARRRKVHFLWITLLLGVAASALVGYMLYWIATSDRF